MIGTHLWASSIWQPCVNVYVDWHACVRNHSEFSAALFWFLFHATSNLATQSQFLPLVPHPLSSVVSAQIAPSRKLWTLAWAGLQSAIKLTLGALCPSPSNTFWDDDSVSGFGMRTLTRSRGRALQSTQPSNVQWRHIYIQL